MNELKELRLDDTRVVLKDNHVLSAILPKGHAELDRDISIQGETVIEGAVYARNFEIRTGPLTVKGAVFTQNELHIFNDATGQIHFQKAVGSAGAVVSHAQGCRVLFGADINAKTVNLRNAFVASNIFADEIMLENCVVLGGVFATRQLAVTNVVLGTFNSPSVRAGQSVNLLLPSAFSVEQMSCLPGTIVRNLTLADLGSLMRGMPEKENTGYIVLDPTTEEQRTVLADEAGNTFMVRSYSVVGKVLAADILDLGNMQNHFLLAAGSLGAQLLKTYELGPNAAGEAVQLTPASIAEFFFQLLDGRISPQELDGTFELNDFSAR